MEEGDCPDNIWLVWLGMCVFHVSVCFGLGHSVDLIPLLRLGFYQLELFNRSGVSTPVNFREKHFMKYVSRIFENSFNEFIKNSSKDSSENSFEMYSFSCTSRNFFTNSFKIYQNISGIFKEKIFKNQTNFSKDL